MKKNRIISSLLCLSLAAGLLIPGLPAYAEGEGESGSNSGMKLSKTAKYNESDDTYTITLEAYATGEKVISQVNKDVPTDIVLVLDQSGSMKDPIGKVSFEQYEDETGRWGTTYHTRNQDYYEMRHNGGRANLWHKLDDGSFVSVSVSVVQSETPVDLGNLTNSGYWNYSDDNLYEKVGEEYKPVILDRTWVSTGIISGYYRYTYEFSDGTTITSNRNSTIPPLDSHAPLYTITVDESQNIYTYTYVDADGNTQTIGTSTGAENVYNPPFYERSIDAYAGDSRIVALKSAVTTFANSVAEKAKGADGKLGTKDDINHRVAVVGFASKSGDGNNTELLSITGRNSGSVGVAYDNISNQNLKDVLQDVNTTDGQTMVTKAINALATEGATEIDLGMDMAQRILEKNPVPAGEKRNRVVVVFTDGAPTTYDGFNKTVANNAISKATAIKNSGATVYSVGIFPGADPTSPGTEPSGDLWEGSSSIPAASNWFMQNLSSNNGTVNIPGCYLSASDSTTLNSIFEKLADNIESGGSSTTLNSSAVIKDIISPQFQLPAGTQPSDITVQTVPCTGITNDVPSWGNPKTFTDAVITVDADTGAVSVSGFDFAGNYVGMDNIIGTEQLHDPAKKLVISFTVSPKPGFLGGNNVYTNTSAGVYESANAQNPVLTFDRPQVNVRIKDVTVTPEDKNVYLLADVTAAQLKDGAAVKVGDVELNLSEENYGLQTWQNEYVNITVEIKDKDGKVVSTDLSKLKDDTTYTITVTVAPKTKGEGADKGTPATEQTGNGTKNINVYKPELTYKDSEVFYGDDVPTDADLAANLKETVWKHGDTVANADMGPAPTLTFTYVPDSTKIANGKINSKDDIQVKATVKIKDTDVTANTIFAHTACAEGVTCSWNVAAPNGNPAFLLHVKTASLIINKTGADGNKNEGFIFNVTGPNNLTFRVSVKDNGSVKITGLPLGTYTVTEDEGWSWRYTPTGSAYAELTKDKPEGTVTIENKKDNPYLLDGSAYARNNSVQGSSVN